jgi:hypothetical protein
MGEKPEKLGKRLFLRDERNAKMGLKGWRLGG